MLGPQCSWQALAVRAFQNPGQIGILSRVQLGQGVFGACQDSIRNTPLDITKETRISATAAHDKAREEDLEHESPTPGVPSAVVEGDSLLEGTVREQSLHLTSRMN